MPLIKYIKNDDGWPLVAPPPPKRVSPIGAKSVQTHAISYTTLDVRTALNGAPQTTNKPMKTMLIITHVRVSLRIWIAVWILLNAMAYFTFAFQFNVVATWLTIHKSRYWTIIVNIKCSRDFENSINDSWVNSETWSISSLPTSKTQAYYDPNNSLLDPVEVRILPAHCRIPGTLAVSMIVTHLGMRRV